MLNCYTLFTLLTLLLEQGFTVRMPLLTETSNNSLLIIAGNNIKVSKKAASCPLRAQVQSCAGG